MAGDRRGREIYKNRVKVSNLNHTGLVRKESERTEASGREAEELETEGTHAHKLTI